MENDDAEGEEEGEEDSQSVRKSTMKSLQDAGLESLVSEEEFRDGAEEGFELREEFKVRLVLVHFFPDPSSLPPFFNCFPSNYDYSFLLSFLPSFFPSSFQPAFLSPILWPFSFVFPFFSFFLYSFFTSCLPPYFHHDPICLLPSPTADFPQLQLDSSFFRNLRISLSSPMDGTRGGSARRPKSPASRQGPGHGRG